jgi:uncharacterized protein YgbK (DUF1537 family)
VVDAAIERRPARAGAKRLQRRWPLVVAGSGLAIGLPGALGPGRRGPRLQAELPPPQRRCGGGQSGSCSLATNAQVAAFIAAGGHPAFAVDPLRLAAGRGCGGRGPGLGGAAAGQAGPVLVYATAEPQR